MASKESVYFIFSMLGKSPTKETTSNYVGKISIKDLVDKLKTRSRYKAIEIK
jgi:hypothetical protein